MKKKHIPLLISALISANTMASTETQEEFVVVNEFYEIDELPLLNQ